MESNRTGVKRVFTGKVTGRQDKTPTGVSIINAN